MKPSRLRVLALGIVLAGAIIVGLFGLRTLYVVREFRQHGQASVMSAETDVNQIRHWMTIPFIARMYHVSPDLLYEELGIPARGNQEKSLRQLNEQYFREAPGIVEQKIKAVLLENIAPPLPTPPNSTDG